MVYFRSDLGLFQVRSHQIMVYFRSYLTRSTLSQICPDLVYFRSNLTRSWSTSGQIWPDLVCFRSDLTRSCLLQTDFDQIMSTSDQIWPDLVYLWQDMTRSCLPLTIYDQVWVHLRSTLPGLDSSSFFFYTMQTYIFCFLRQHYQHSLMSIQFLWLC